MQQWEYKTVFVDESANPKQVLELLEEKGEDGWELIGVCGNYDHCEKFLFKRPKQPPKMYATIEEAKAAIEAEGVARKCKHGKLNPRPRKITCEDCIFEYLEAGDRGNAKEKKLVASFELIAPVDIKRGDTVYVSNSGEVTVVSCEKTEKICSHGFFIVEGWTCKECIDQTAAQYLSGGTHTHPEGTKCSCAPVFAPEPDVAPGEGCSISCRCPGSCQKPC